MLIAVDILVPKIFLYGFTAHTKVIYKFDSKENSIIKNCLLIDSKNLN